MTDSLNHDTQIPSDVGSGGAEARDLQRIDSMCRKGSIRRLAEKYIAFCLTDERQRLPNMAGFFRWMKLSAAARDHFQSFHREDCRTVKMIFEDEALNSPLPPSIVSTYVKQYFSSDADRPDEGCGGITLLFDHDIEHDGK